MVYVPASNCGIEGVWSLFSALSMNEVSHHGIESKSGLVTGIGPLTHVLVRF